jgi:large subunit ribosomal protein L4
VNEALAKLEMTRGALIVTGAPERTLLLSARNIPDTKVIPADYLNVVDLVNHRGVVMTVEAVRRAEALWGGERAKKRLAAVPEVARG